MDQNINVGWDDILADIAKDAIEGTGYRVGGVHKSRRLMDANDVGYAIHLKRKDDFERIVSVYIRGNTLNVAGQIFQISNPNIVPFIKLAIIGEMRYQ